jgi:hypothetical protein
MTPMHHRGRSFRAAARLSQIVSLAVTSAILIAAPALKSAARAGEIPTFAVDASWPKPLPNNWILGQVGGITVDWQAISG